MEKKRNLWVIPTDKPSRLMLRHRILFFFKDDDSIPKGTAKNQNIYITSDEEIKEGDWYFFNVGYASGIKKADENDVKQIHLEIEPRKIILTTDNEDLIKDGVQAINDEFLEWFVNNPSCEEVDVNKSYGGTYYITYPYKIIIPKEETKKEYQTCKCGSNWFNTTVDDKPFCFKCGESVKEDFKPTEKTCTCTDECLGYLTKTCKGIETIEEAAVKWIRQPKLITEKESFIAGAKWQQERMYSEEDMREAFRVGFNVGYNDETSPSYLTFEEWINKFKKK